MSTPAVAALALLFGVAQVLLEVVVRLVKVAAEECAAMHRMHVIVGLEAVVVAQQNTRSVLEPLFASAIPIVDSTRSCAWSTVFAGTVVSSLPPNSPAMVAVAVVAVLAFAVERHCCPP